GLVVAIIALALQSVVVYRQRVQRRQHGLPEASTGRVFPSFQIDELDRSMFDLLKFVVDFGFYKFGFEYIVYVGLPEDTCFAYPWDHLFGEPSTLTKNVNFDIWFGLSNYAINWPAENLIADFILLLVASCQ
ncbi:hypothetical protein TELCIR_21388, partial [Teladorsagia circumcincta]